MKRLLLLSAFTAISVMVFGQNNKVVSAFNYHKYYKERGNKITDLRQAIENIELAVAHEQTMGSAKAWYYRGQIYHSLFECKDESVIAEKPNSLQETLKSYMKTLELDSKKEYEKDVMMRLNITQIQYVNLGVEQFEAKDYSNALTSFENAVAVKAMFKSLDTLALYNAALCAEKANMPDKAIEYYNSLVKVKYGGANTYLFIANLYRQKKDEEKAIEVIKNGRAAFPDDKNLIIEELNYYLLKGQLKEAIANLELAIEKDPKNHILLFSMGSVYDNIANPPKDKPQPKEVEFNELMDKAESSYKRALEIKPDYFDAIYNLGALYYNQDVRINDIAQEIKDNKKYAEEMKKADAKFEVALPYLEKAHELDPKDKNTLISLQQLYARTGQNEKYKKVKELLTN